MGDLKSIVFYASENREIVRDFIDGYLHYITNTIFWDQDIGPIGTWTHQISQNFHKSDIVIVFVSTDYLSRAKGYVANTEIPFIIDAFLDKAKLIFPIVIGEGCPWQLSAFGENNIPFFRNGGVVLASHPNNKDINRAHFLEFSKIIKSEIEKKYNTSRSLTVNKFTTPKSSIQSIWESIPTIATQDELFLCDCDREQEFNTLVTDYLSQESEDRNHYYFIAGCNTQKPESIVTRLILSNREALDLIFVKDYFNPDTIQIEVRPGKTWANFLTKFVNWLPSHDFPKDIDFDFFKNIAPDYLQKGKRYPLFFMISEDSWGIPDIELRLKEIIDQFSTLPAGCHRFSFFFIVEISGLHSIHLQENPKVQNRIRRIKQVCEEQYNCEYPPHIKDVFLWNTVPDTEARKWLKRIIDRKGCTEKTKEDYVDLVLQCFHSELSEPEREYYNSNSAYNMDRLEIMQRHAFQYLTR